MFVSAQELVELGICDVYRLAPRVSLCPIGFIAPGHSMIDCAVWRSYADRRTH